MKAQYTLIKNARLINHGEGLPQNCSILIKKEEGQPWRIAEIGKVQTDNIEGSVFTYDARSHYVSAGFTDLCTHACEPGNMSDETLISVSKAAAAGGFTSILTTPDTVPCSDTAGVIEYVISNSKKSECRILPSASATMGNGSLKPAPVEELMKSGAAAVFATSYVDPDTLLDLMKLCREKSYPLIIKCSEPCKYGSTDDVPKIKEDIATATAIILAKESGCKIHISCVSSRGAVDIIRRAKDAGANITCDTCPQYFIFEKHDVLFFGNNLKLMPPLGTEEDKIAIIQGIKDGTIDCISSDHTPRPESSKNAKNVTYEKASCGMISLQTLFSASYTHLVNREIISLQRLIEMIAYNPAAILGRQGELTDGGVADITVFSASSRDTHEIKREDNKSRSSNSPFFGQTLCGTVIKTFVGDELPA